MSLPTTGLQPLDEYCEGVKSGDIAVCKWVRLAVDRHYRDLRRQKTEDFPYYFEPEAAKHFVSFFAEQLAHYEGAIDGEPIEFEPWQWFTFGSIFGWLKVKRFKDIPIRRFREGIVIIPKKNGKSIISGGTGLYMMDWDGWPGAQCYILAKNMSHAKDLGYRAATNMVENSPEMDEKYRIKRAAGDTGIFYKGNNNAFYKPITSKPDSEDGRNVHFCGPDETKDWTDFEIYDVMKNGTVNAPNSLFLSTTTAGPNKDSLGYDQQKYLEQVLEGVVDDEQTFGVIYTIDEEDRYDEDGNEIQGYWKDPKVWEKANPNYEVSVFEDVLKSMIPRAEESIGKRIAFETKHLNIWHSSESGFIKSEQYEACNLQRYHPDNPPPFMQHAECFSGLDLGAVSDFSAYLKVFPPQEDDKYHVLCDFWIPEATLRERKNYDVILPWIEEGWIKTTPGNATDYKMLQDYILTDSDGYDLQELAYDPWKAEQMAISLQDQGLTVVPFRQGYKSMSEPIDEVERLILDNKIEFGGNPVLKWMFSNIVVQADPAGNRKFDKGASQDKIDGAVALLMGIKRAIVNEPEGDQYYNGYAMRV